MRAADKDLIIMTDFAGYGHYSNPIGFAKYFTSVVRAISRLRPGRFRVLLYADSQFKRARTAQFPEDEFQRELEGQAFEQYFHQNHHLGSQPETWKDFISLLDREENRYRHQLLDAGIEVRVLAESFPFFIWLRDDEQAVFSLQSTGDPEFEVAFSTTEPVLVPSLKRLFEEKMWDRASRLSRLSDDNR